MADAARFLRVPPATLSSWFKGRSFPKKQGGLGESKRLIVPADTKSSRLSFFNVVEAHVLRALRTDHSIPLHVVRTALDFAETELGIEHVLLSDDLLTAQGELFLDYYGSLISLGRSGQIAMRKMLERYLRRVERDDRHIPIRLFPFVTEAHTESQSIVIDPVVSFGRPTVAGSGITTSILVRRIDAGETIEHLAYDYDLPAEKITDAVLFEKAA